MYDYCFFSHIVFVTVRKILFRLFYIFCLSPILSYSLLSILSFEFVDYNKMNAMTAASANNPA